MPEQKKTDLNLPQKFHIPWVADEAHSETRASATDATDAADPVNVIGYEMRKFVIDNMTRLTETTIDMLQIDMSLTQCNLLILEKSQRHK